MDAQAQKKALFRAKLKEAAQKQEKRIDSPLVRYNEYDQPVCRVCDVTLKSESLWNAHQASRKHHEAIKNVKAAAAATAAGVKRGNDVKSDSPTELAQKPRTSTSLPADFFDKNETKKRKTGLDAGESIHTLQASVTSKGSGSSTYVAKKDGPPVMSHPLETPDYVKMKDELASEPVGSKETSESKPFSQVHAKTDLSEVKQLKGGLPVGFFDNKDADLRARGIEPVKVDIKDEYKEFEKVIQEDLHEVDERLEEEEFDAAELREEAESLEQKAYTERVEMLKKMQVELKAAKLARAQKQPIAFRGEKSSEESASDDDDNDDDNFTVDWRAKHL